MRHHRRIPPKEGRDQHSKPLWIHEDAELDEASEKVGNLYHRWSTAAEEYIVKCTWQCQIFIGSGTMVKTKTAPILLHVAKHGRAGESRRLMAHVTLA